MDVRKDIQMYRRIENSICDMKRALAPFGLMPKNDKNGTKFPNKN
jgi:hypothetical protein